MKLMQNMMIKLLYENTTPTLLLVKVLFITSVFALGVGLFSPAISFSENVMISVEEVEQNITTTDLKEQINQQPRVLVFDVIYTAQPNKNSLLLSATATVILEERLKNIPGITFVSLQQPAKSRTENGDQEPKPQPESQAPSALFDTEAVGEILSFQETCLEGGLIFLGVRKMLYELTFSLSLRNVFSRKDIFRGSATSTFTDKSIGFKRRNLQLSVPAAHILLKPAIDTILLELSTNTELVTR